MSLFRLRSNGRGHAQPDVRADETWSRRPPLPIGIPPRRGKGTKMTKVGFTATYDEAALRSKPAIGDAFRRSETGHARKASHPGSFHQDETGRLRRTGHPQRLRRNEMAAHSGPAARDALATAEIATRGKPAIRDAFTTTKPGHPRRTSHPQRSRHSKQATHNEPTIRNAPAAINDRSQRARHPRRSRHNQTRPPAKNRPSGTPSRRRKRDCLRCGAFGVAKRPALWGAGRLGSFGQWWSRLVLRSSW